MTAKEAASIAEANLNEQLSRALDAISYSAYMGLTKLTIEEKLSEKTVKSLEILGYNVIEQDVTSILWNSH